VLYDVKREERKSKVREKIAQKIVE